MQETDLREIEFFRAAKHPLAGRMLVSNPPAEFSAGPASGRRGPKRGGQADEPQRAAGLTPRKTQRAP